MFSLKTILCISGTLLLAAAAGGLQAQVFDEVRTRDGSTIVGEIQSMTDGVLKVKSAFSADVVSIKWSEVESLRTVKAREFVVTGPDPEHPTTLMGTAEGATARNLSLAVPNVAQPTSVSLASIVAIDPPPHKPWTFKGNFNLGTSVSDGNAQNKALNWIGDVEARSTLLRFTVRTAYNYAEDSQSGVTVQSGKAQLKADYFFTKWFYVFASALFEHDGIQDLDLRSAYSAGPGAQLIDKDEARPEWNREMQLSAEAGIAYVKEEFAHGAPGNEYVSARWAVKFDWPFVPKRMTFFHYQEGYPGLERARDLYITTETGLRLSIWNNFVATLQVNWRWDNTPPPGRERDDTLYLATLGYSFEI